MSQAIPSTTWQPICGRLAQWSTEWLTLMPVFSTPGAYNYYLVNMDAFPLEELRKRGASSDAVLFIRSLMGPHPGERLASDKPVEHVGLHLLRAS
ncbi:hypothetical protein M441DRAFT_452619 [Trichoderma asperellum CBS 433.97]|uniref:Uncharacterized protein n=1 Tax=Trichoderma asperellum (strain ATCC 204424 / CBS 433.97 / NBRC 101777) TaxID=1042311 RepID=A0A2T3YRU5_TRIA4|nr:hypothetical protein M441DRAFT_452619 [Trichoderma asperellum CBS 433.97]PTB35300.1 hypothetical protein M441DRAFT_452619 [Trichoderma asperellum CBS 433.97]